MTDILILIHAVNTTSGTIPDWCTKNSLSCEVVPAERLGDRRAKNYNSLVVMGGDMEVWDAEKFPWLLPEKALIREFIDSGKPVFGVCLGSQLLAEQLGGQIKPMGQWELGWFEVKLADGQMITPFHCHSSKFDPPPRALTTASNEMDCTQGFHLGDRFIGYQFHVEIDRTRINHIVKNIKRSETGQVQSTEELLAGYEAHGAALKEFCFSALDSWWQANHRA